MTWNRLMALFVHTFSLFSIKYNRTIIYEKLLSEYLSCEFTSCFLATYHKARGDTPFLVFCSQRRQKCYSCGKCKPGRHWRQGGGRKYVKCLKVGSVNIIFPLPILLKSQIFRPTDKARRERFVSMCKARAYFWIASSEGHYCSKSNHGLSYFNTSNTKLAAWVSAWLVISPGLG